MSTTHVNVYLIAWLKFMSSLRNSHNLQDISHNENMLYNVINGVIVNYNRL